VAGSAMEQGWAYVVDWHKHGKLDDEVSEPEFDSQGRLMRRTNFGELVEVFLPHFLPFECGELCSQRSSIRNYLSKHYITTYLKGWIFLPLLSMRRFERGEEQSI
jgi:hypothetical protein